MEQSYAIYEDKHVMAFLNHNPFSIGHTLIIPKKHYINMFDIDESAYLEVMQVVRLLLKTYEKKLGISGADLLNLNGIEGQQTVFHFHVHLIPRRDGDELVPWINSVPRNKYDFREIQKKLSLI